ncbi:MAG: hypothetical protein ACFFB6_14445 [Promethearchaeota archaeon]
MSKEKYFNDEESRNTLYLVFDLVKRRFNGRKISKRLIYKTLKLITNSYIDNFNATEFELFLLDPVYSTKEHIIFPSNNGFLIKYSTFLFLIQLYISFSYRAEILLEKEIIKILIYIQQDNSKEEEVLDFFKILNSSLIRLDIERFFVNRIMYEADMNLEHNKQPYLLADFFIDYMMRNKRPDLSLSELKNRLTLSNKYSTNL